MEDKLEQRKRDTRNLYGKKGKDLFGMANSKEVIEFIEGYGVKPLFLTITGSHMWNLASPDADLDIRGIYIKPTELILSLRKGSDTIEACSVLWKDIDIQLYEVEKAFGMLQKHNGNMVEMLLSPTTFYQTLDVDWQKIAKKYLTKRLAHYYKGYYQSQRKRAMVNRGGKALTYTYREIYQGIWLMRHGKMVYDFRELKTRFEEEFQPSKLLDWWMDKKTWKVPVSESDLANFEKEWEMLIAIFEREYRGSKLPDDYDGYTELNNILLGLRKKN